MFLESNPDLSKDEYDTLQTISKTIISHKSISKLIDFYQLQNKLSLLRCKENFTFLKM